MIEVIPQYGKVDILGCKTLRKLLLRRLPLALGFTRLSLMTSVISVESNELIPFPKLFYFGDSI